MLWLLTDRADVVQLARCWPPTAAIVPEPSAVVPSKKVTVPPGVPDPGATKPTVAVKVTAWPKTDWPGEALTVIKVLALPTVRGVPVEMLELKLPSPA